MSSLYGMAVPLPDGTEFNFSQTKGKVVLIVNVASKCGFTPQYEGLEALWQKYKDKDFVLIGFPCNQFGGQEPGTDAEVASFCKLNYGVSFPVTKKCDVNGDNACDVFKLVKNEKPGIVSNLFILRKI
ncbi:thioredoxin-like protein, partial [Phakopsora pachyrhizi]